MTGEGEQGRPYGAFSFCLYPVHSRTKKSRNKRVYGLARQVISCYNTKR